MRLDVIVAKDLDDLDAAFIRRALTRPGSDFGTALACGRPSGLIALCREQGEIVGWARTEPWDGLATLEAFTAAPYRQRGIAALCASGLVAAGAYVDAPAAAIFREYMIPLAKRVGLKYVLYAKEGSAWIKTRSMPSST